MMTPHRQQYGLGSFVKKITRPIKKVVKSPLGKAALIGGLGWAANAGKLGGMGEGWFPKFRGLFQEGKLLGNLLHTGAGPDRKFSLGKAGLLGLLGAGATLPFLGGDEEEEIIETPWEETPSSIANIRQMARDRHPSLMFLPKSDYVQEGFFTGAKDGGLIGLANGGQPAQAQAEQMLRMEYQKYRNQGGTMSYQQFKMQVLKQAQAQGPMAQGQPQMMSQGGRAGYKWGEMVEKLSWATPAGAGFNLGKMMGKKFKGGDEVVTDQMEEIEGDTAGPAGYHRILEEQMSLLAEELDKHPSDLTDDEYELAGNRAMQIWRSGGFAQGGRAGYASGTAYPNPHAVRSGNLKDDMLNVFANKFGGRKIATPGSPVATSNSLMGNLVPQAFQGQDAEYQAYLESGSELPYHVWKTSRQTVAQCGRVGLLGGGPVPGSTVPGYTTPVGYNKFDYRTGGVPVRVGAANGGIMPLLDLKGKEKDYRQDGGFVGIGRKEKADDVPARLSKNEFVFTADAVRNAGGGDIDAGAEVMHNMMKNLEAGGQISEESQGIGAQGMYDNMRQLETRIE